MEEFIIRDAFKLKEHIYVNSNGDLFAKFGKFLIVYFQSNGETKVYGIGFNNKRTMFKELLDIIDFFDTNTFNKEDCNLNDGDDDNDDEADVNNVTKGIKGYKNKTKTRIKKTSFCSSDVVIQNSSEAKTSSLTCAPLLPLEDMFSVNLFNESSNNYIEFKQMGGAYSLVVRISDIPSQQTRIIKVDENLVCKLTYQLKRIRQSPFFFFFDMIGDNKSFRNKFAINVYLNYVDENQDKKYHKQIEKDFSIIFNINSTNDNSHTIVLFNKLLSLENVRFFYMQDNYEGLRYFLAHIPQSLLWPLRPLSNTAKMK